MSPSLLCGDTDSGQVCDSCALRVDALVFSDTAGAHCHVCAFGLLNTRVAVLTSALRHARDDIAEIHRAGFDSTRREMARAAVVRITEALGA